MILRKTLDENGRIVKTLEPSDIATLGVFLTYSLKSQKLIFGEAGEITEERNMHVYLAKLVTKLDQENREIDAIDRNAIPPRKGKNI